MKIDLSDLTGGLKKELSFDYPLTVEDNFRGVTFPEPIFVHGDVRNSAGYIKLAVSADVSYETYCDRCLKPITPHLSLSFTRTLVKKGTLENSSDESDMDYLELDAGQLLDIDETVREEFILSFPTKHLCREDCKGLCPVCGGDLNVAECGCKEEKTSSVWDEALRRLSGNDGETGGE